MKLSLCCMFKLVPKLRKWAWAAGILMVLEGISAPTTGNSCAA